MDGSKVPAAANGGGVGDGGAKEAGGALGVPGVVYVGPAPATSAAAAGRHLVQTGPAAGWMNPRGIQKWERELSVVTRGSVSQELRSALGVTLPEEQVPPARLPWASRAAQASPLLGVASSLVEKLVQKGVRVHTVGFDRMSGGFYYFAEGGERPAVRIQGDLFEMIGPALQAKSETADIDRLLDGLLDRLLAQLSGGDLSETSLELAAALPKMATDGSGTVDCDLEAFEKEAAALAKRAEGLGPRAEELAAALRATGGASSLPVPLFGEAKREEQAALEVEASAERIALPARARWYVSGIITEVAKPVEPAAAKAAEPEKAAAKRPADTAKPADKAAAKAKDAVPAKVAEAAKPAEKAKATKADKAATKAEKATAEKTKAAEKAAAEKVAAENATAEKAAAAKAAADKQAAAKAAADKAAADKQAADKAAAAKAAADKQAADKQAADKAAAAKAAADKQAAAKAAKPAEKDAGPVSGPKSTREVPRPERSSSPSHDEKPAAAAKTPEPEAASKKIDAAQVKPEPSPDKAEAQPEKPAAKTDAAKANKPRADKADKVVAKSDVESDTPGKSDSKQEKAAKADKASGKGAKRGERDSDEVRVDSSGEADWAAKTGKVERRREKGAAPIEPARTPAEPVPAGGGSTRTVVMILVALVIAAIVWKVVKG